MINNKTVFVIGAGASKEVDLPTGDELRGIIASLLDIRTRTRDLALISGDPTILEAIHVRVRGNVEPAPTSQEYMRAAHAISAGIALAPSIDNYIDSHRGDKAVELCGKLAIVRSILNAERKSNIYVDPLKSDAALSMKQAGGSWFARFFQILTENAEAGQIADRLLSMSFIVFNYDRCLEHFLYESLQLYYSVPAGEAAALINDLKIYHPYGMVGPLPWQQKPKESIGFGGDTDARMLLRLSDNIKTFTEGADVNNSEIVEIRRKFIKASIIVFLGFAFHKLNIALMHDGDNAVRTSTADVYGTAWQISPSDIEIVSRDLSARFGFQSPKITLRADRMCAPLFNEYRRTFGLS